MGFKEDGCAKTVAKQEAKLDIMLNRLIERADQARRLATNVSMALMSADSRKKEASQKIMEPCPPSEFPANTVLNGMEMAEYTINRACQELESILCGLNDIVGDAGILY